MTTSGTTRRTAPATGAGETTNPDADLFAAFAEWQRLDAEDNALFDRVDDEATRVRKLYPEPSPLIIDGGYVGEDGAVHAHVMWTEKAVARRYPYLRPGDLHTMAMTELARHQEACRVIDEREGLAELRQREKDTRAAAREAWRRFLDTPADTAAGLALKLSVYRRYLGLRAVHEDDGFDMDQMAVLAVCRDLDRFGGGAVIAGENEADARFFASFAQWEWTRAEWRTVGGDDDEINALGDREWEQVASLARMPVRSPRAVAMKLQLLEYLLDVGPGPLGSEIVRTAIEAVGQIAALSWAGDDERTRHGQPQKPTGA